jgi:hypothetical protein
MVLSRIDYAVIVAIVTLGRALPFIFNDRFGGLMVSCLKLGHGKLLIGRTTGTMRTTASALKLLEKRMGGNEGLHYYGT